LNNTSLEALNAGASVNPRSQPKKEKVERVRIGISSCLLGERVRFDGGHKRDASCVFSYKRWLDFGTRRPTRAAVMPFHARHKFLLMAHSQAGVRTLGNLVAAETGYFLAFCEVMRRIPTRRNHTNVLQHMSGYFSKQLDSSDRAELAELIESYRRGLIPIIVPVTLIRPLRSKIRGHVSGRSGLPKSPSDELMLLNEL
jgi:uncharacterized protein YbgA (DUF1722 family)